MLGYYEENEDLRIAEEFCTVWRKNGGDIPPDFHYKILGWAQGGNFTAINVYSLTTVMYADVWEQSHKLIGVLSKTLSCPPQKIFETMPQSMLHISKSRIMAVHMSVSTLFMAAVVARKYSKDKYEVHINEYNVGVIVPKGGN